MESLKKKSTSQPRQSSLGDSDPVNHLLRTWLKSLLIPQESRLTLQPSWGRAIRVRHAVTFKGGWAWNDPNLYSWFQFTIMISVYHPINLTVLHVLLTMYVTRYCNKSLNVPPYQYFFGSPPYKASLRSFFWYTLIITTFTHKHVQWCFIAAPLHEAYLLGLHKVCRNKTPTRSQSTRVLEHSLHMTSLKQGLLKSERANMSRFLLPSHGFEWGHQPPNRLPAPWFPMAKVTMLNVQPKFEHSLAAHVDPILPICGTFIGTKCESKHVKGEEPPSYHHPTVLQKFFSHLHYSQVPAKVDPCYLWQMAGNAWISWKKGGALREAAKLPPIGTEGLVQRI